MAIEETSTGDPSARNTPPQPTTSGQPNPAPGNPSGETSPPEIAVNGETEPVAEQAEPAAKITEHVHVMGDLAEMQIILQQQDLPDHVDPTLAPYRKVRGFIKKYLPGGAWSLADNIRYALGDIWRTDASFSAIAEVNLEKSTVGPLLWLTYLDTTNKQNTSVSTTVEKYKIGADNSEIMDPDNNPKAKEKEGELKQDGNSSANQPTTRELSYTPCWSKNRKASAEQASAEQDSAEQDNKGQSDDVAHFEFQGGIVDGVITIEQSETPRKSFQIHDDWPPSLTFWPTKEKIELAIRVLTKDELPPDEKQGLNGYAGTPFPLFREKHKDKDFWAPLDAFLIPTNPATHPATHPASRAVLLISPGWEKAVGSNPVGYFMFSPISKDWEFWACRAAIVSEIAKPDAEVEVQAERLKLTFSAPKEGEFFGFPISVDVVRLMHPHYRPTQQLKPPVAIVTTVQEHPQSSSEDESATTVVKPVWHIKRYDGDDQKPVFRLEEANGYQFPRDWVKDTQIRYTNEKKKVGENGKTPPSELETDDQSLLRAMEWGLDRMYTHGEFIPQWVPHDIVGEKAFKHLAIMDLNFGFRRDSRETEKRNVLNLFDTDFAQCKTSGFLNGMSNVFSAQAAPEAGGAYDSDPSAGNKSQPSGEEKPAGDGSQPAESDTTQETSSDKGSEDSDNVLRPDWWYPLLKYRLLKDGGKEEGGKEEGKTAPNQHGWIVGVFGRQLPFEDGITDHNKLAWAENDLWSVVRQHFSQSSVAILSAQLLRASGAKISHRLSWEKTVDDCLNELATPRFKALLHFRHLIVRFGCAAAIHVFNPEPPENNNPDWRTQNLRDRVTLYYDATSPNGFYRDVRAQGRVAGNNTVFASRVLQSLIGVAPPTGVNQGEEGQKDKEKQGIEKAIRQALCDCQLLYRHGYGHSFEEKHGSRMDQRRAAEVLFDQYHEEGKK